MDQLADLHIHTYYSDSSLSPEQVVAEANDKGLSCIAITDHDIIDGVEPAMNAAKGLNLEIIPGIELSSEINGKDVHILGYFMDACDKSFLSRIKIMQDKRMDRMRNIIKKLEPLGIDDILLEDVCAMTKSNCVGRPHLAKMLIEKGYCKNVKQVFNKYIGEGCPAYVPKYKQTPYEAIDLIRQCNGLAILAHPMLTQVDSLILSLTEAGLDGLEVFYPNISNKVIEFYKKLANKYGILVTGGSDYHGEMKSNIRMGCPSISYEYVDAMKKRLRDRC